MSELTVNPIGTVHSCYSEKFGIPRQPGLVPAAKARIEILPPFNRPEAFAGIEQHSHLWLEFVFHQNIRSQWKASVRPPRLGGNQKMGVFATRSSFRPNNLGLSVVKFEQLIIQGSKIFVEVSGIDLLDQTPVIDIKPYIPYSDSLVNAQSQLASAAPEMLQVNLSQSAKLFCQQWQHPLCDDLSSLIQQVLAQDPRPAYQQDAERIYGMQLFDLNIRFQIDNGLVKVIEIVE
ncbi:tRNA (N6-threonylcarbamoyladenosine(37)-N6)-methyltransferase TrmO [Pelagibaculum spongiae]|uniref:tRNA (N6-threonylcarbamoyladenosine(37)-N6)-methyltransferase TrmO n=1 Tax=Pelagibaculum spongiae TaxID=2080658 RepID=A0A2V1GP27_9GAMM|nr:tRNA (N6-threonylcarbamoyladenosine(37)-N6)-methyltransferase TrmO [Pelagibaculum spongiae]PVZ64325.1 tRNA (N6-threonylcarbamoyladenosine(37)-N6)-methyltransferase TrmO [Pelagibaculum spongiae]